jgi:hypothetical protein
MSSTTSGAVEGSPEPVTSGHDQRPSQIRVPLDVLARVPDEASTVSQVVGVAHRDHGILAEVVVADAPHVAMPNDGYTDEECAEEDESNQGAGE